MKKGITLAVLSVVILIMVIFTTAVATTGSMALNNSKKLKFAAEIALVQEMVDEYVSEQNGEYPVRASFEVNLSNVTTNSITQFDNEPKNSNSITLYEIDFSLMGKADLVYGTKKHGDAKDVYAVSQETGIVYYIKGVKVSKITYYTLTNDLKELIGYTENTNGITKDGIVFNTSNNAWTNQGISSTIKIPTTSGFTDITVYLQKNDGTATTVAVAETTNGYDVYQINAVAENYSVLVEYLKDSKYTSQTFSVTNYDNVAPTITVKETKDMVNDNSGVNQTYISLDIIDELSGIKVAKYETENIAHENAKQYFTNNGLSVSNNTIIVPGEVQYVTVYVEDKAGNYTTRLVEVVTTNDYSRNGLVMHYDGINNTGNGHDSSARTWTDLSVRGNDVSLNTDNSFDSNSCVFKKEAYSGLSPVNPLKLGVNGGFTIECIAKSNTTETTDVHYSDTLYDWFWNLRDEDGKKYLEYIRMYTGTYTMMGANDGSEFIRDNSSGNRIVVSQFVISNDKILNYYDGTLTTSKDSSNNLLNTILSINGLDIGYARWYSVTNNYSSAIGLNGNIYSFRVYNRALTEEEILRNYKVDKIRYGL